MDKEDALTTRRTFVKSASQVAVTAPAVSLLLAASTKMASALPIYPCGPGDVVINTPCQVPVLDDFTVGNSEEDIDAINLGSNFNPLTGQANQDDVFVP